jgi:hypothetical protein
MTPELKASVSIDALLVAADWHACSLADADIHLVAYVTAANLLGAKGLSQAKLAHAFSSDQ